MAQKKRALITGITGQDGSYLAELLHQKGYEVHGIVRRVALEDPTRRLWRLRGVLDKLHLHPASVESYASLFKIVQQVQPDECYHLAAQSFVGYSFDDEFSTVNSNINGTHFMLSVIKECAPRCRFYFAASSEMFGNSMQSPQNEETAFRPRSPYGISKVAGYHLTRNYREAYGLYCASGMLFNHESERRGREFVTRKITLGVAAIAAGQTRSLHLGNLDARRDWGYAPEYVEAMWRMLQQDTPDDYIIATGQAHSVREFVEAAFAVVGLNWQNYVVIDKELHRPAEVHELRGDASKARQRLGWQPELSFAELVRRMVEADIDQLQLEGPELRTTPPIPLRKVS